MTRFQIACALSVLTMTGLAFGQATTGGGPRDGGSRGGGGGGGGSRDAPPQRGGGGGGSREAPPQRGGGGGGSRNDDAPPRRGGPDEGPRSGGGSRGSGGSRNDDAPPRRGGPDEGPRSGGGSRGSGGSRNDDAPPRRGGPDEGPRSGGGSRADDGGASAGGRSDGSRGSRGRPTDDGSGRSGGGGARIGGGPGTDDGWVRSSGSGRSGRSSYGSINNGSVRGRGISIGIGSPPIDILVPGNRRSQIDVRGRNWRIGYYHYDSRWRDDYFWYPWYVFNPHDNWDRCVVSPWYYYPSLPPYLTGTRVSIVSVLPPRVFGDRFDYPSPWGRDDSRPAYLNEALDDIVAMFLDQDRRALARLLPDRGGVNVYISGRYVYTLDADDFYDMTLDAIFNVRTRDYEIISVRRQRDYAEVIARHDFSDPWNGRSRVYHNYRLEYGRGGAVIREFGTNTARTW